MRAKWLFVAALVMLLANPLHAQATCAKGECMKCHTLTVDEAKQILETKVQNVLSVSQSIMPGIWEIEGIVGRTKMPIFMDYSKTYYVVGIIESVDGTQGGLEKMKIKYPVLGLREQMQKELMKKQGRK